MIKSILFNAISSSLKIGVAKPCGYMKLDIISLLSLTNISTVISYFSWVLIILSLYLNPIKLKISINYLRSGNKIRSTLKQ